MSLLDARAGSVRVLLARSAIRQRLRRCADRRERVAELVRHVGGEALGEAQVRVEPAGERLERAGQLADLVGRAACRGTRAASRPRASTSASASSRSWRSGRTIVKEANDRQHDGEDERDDHDLEHPEAHVVQPLQDAPGRLRDEHDAGRRRAAARTGRAA